MFSVCIATYNGENYVRRQLESVLQGIGTEDEVVISDDGSSDRTVDIIKGYDDTRIRIYEHQHDHSPIFNFENAIIHAKGDVIFLADQDDKWLSDRVAEAMRLHKEGYNLVICNHRDVFDWGEHISNNNPFARPWWKNLWKPAYTGCMMSMDRKVLDLVMPFPKGIAMHDLWIGLLAQRNLKCGYIAKPVVEYNRHGESYIAQHPRSMWNRICYRVTMLREVKRRENEKNLR